MHRNSCSNELHQSIIKEVRSATLDTWLPEQVSFMQFMGNDKSNSYWEAELPSDYVGVGTESFIHAKYEEKRWLSKEGTQTPPEGGEEKYSTFKNGSDDEGSVGCSNNSNKPSLEVAIPAKHLPFLSSGTTPTEPYQGSMDMKVPKLSPPMPEPKSRSPVPVHLAPNFSDMLFEEASKENGFRSPSSTLLPPGISPVTPEPKSKSQVPVDSAANVSGMLSVEAPVENAMESSSPKNWARFE
eukprot:TRINITY_DN6833_c0_g1_i6.p1 TRINITY_DN6833_c0_g1~~TRINITY_DN6833_c0_g1_i6.p1  ORF type:complete len:241 (+),score=70.03 TRINITY_DN6833_c0_g1_i6:345-1067(+)